MKPILFALFLACAACGPDEPPPGDPRTASEGAPLDVTSRNPNPPTAVRATHDELLADAAAARHPSDGQGSARIVEGPAVVTAGTRAAWVFEFTVGPLGVAEGGHVTLLASPFWGWTVPQALSPAMPGFSRVELVGAAADDPLALRLDTPGDGRCSAFVEGRALAAGEVLRFQFGGGQSRVTVDRFAEDEERFWFAVDGDGDGVDQRVLDSPTVSIVAGPPTQLHLFLPPTARPGETVELTAVVLDRFGNAGYPFEGELLLVQDSLWPGLLPERATFAAEDAGRLAFELTLPESAYHGVMRVAAGAVGTKRENNRTGALQAISNPMWIDPAAPRLLVADLHGHSNLSDGTGRPEDFYRYARDTAALDVAVLTDHDHWGMRFLDGAPDLWKRIQRAAERANDPGEFTALLGFEWTSWLHGHRHVLYFQDQGEVISSLDAVTPDELWAALRELGKRGMRALTFAHHSAGAPVPTNWSFPPDPQFEPVTEVASVHGTSEAWDAPLKLRAPWKGNFVRDVLDAGVPLGFVGSGDSHDGHPGLAHLEAGTGGLAMLFAETNDREAVRASLLARACYATNGPRIVCVAKLGGALMGGDVPATALGPATTVELKLFGTRSLRLLEVVRSGAVVKELSAAAMGQAPGVPPNYAAELTLAQLGLEDLAPGEYVYLRVTEEGPGLAWTSPWFIK